MVVARQHEGLDAGPHDDDLLESRGWPGRWRLVVGCLVALSIPLVVALVGFRRNPWTPVLDLAMTELRVRDVGGRHTPLIGLPGRIGVRSQQGSHPGPLSFYALAPTYRALGSTAWALQVATFVIHLVAMATALWIASRRGGRGLVVAVAVLLAVLASGYGAGVLTEPWNPYLPLLWWVVVLLAVWSVLCGDLPMLPVAVLAASFSAQTHVPYLALTLGVGALAGTAAVVQWWREPGDRRRAARWIVAATGLGVLLWMPPTVDQLRNDPGNYRQLVEHFSDPPEEPQGLRAGASSALDFFDLAFLAGAGVTDSGGLVGTVPSSRPSAWRGAAVVAVWALAAAVAVRRRHAVLVRLHAVVGASLVLMVLAISRIFGVVWYYLTLWGWAIGLLALVATVWTLLDMLGSRERWANRLPRPEVAVIALALVGILVTGRFAATAWDSPHADASVAAELASVIDAAAAGLEAGEGVSTGRAGRYVVTWTDAFHIGSQGYGLLNELERRGFDVGVDYGARVPATRHRVLDRADATARVHLATGVHVERWRQVPGVVEIVRYDPRDNAERVEQQALRDQVVRALIELGLRDLVPKVDDNLFGAAIDPRVPEATKELMGRMLELGAPLSIFVMPADTPDP